eukprot:CAMPEP_0201938610 /NCGR_PEP_ID=MMETSP0903-20130614/41659_1 /ASSEMBLY_ACC=CAM_ASM_000552 /TAXON_ID=420261 /ORGANISM="Thalassiosira antarctica, Strain CCMP982" /LENGTH=652 /DNA_ID=CAMNT_0048479899 /DNA_START=124 /DNA_END=2079 /DNA_ORIENTATION=+
MEEFNDRVEDDLSVAIKCERNDFGDEFSGQDEDSSAECRDAWSQEDDDEPYSEHGCDALDLAKLEIGFDGYLPHDGNWERCGQVIGRKKQLKELLFYDIDDEVMRGDFSSIFQGVSHNRSICDLSFHYCGLADNRIFSILTPFFKENHNFESLKINGCDLGRDGLHLLTTALTEFDSLKEFELSRCGKDHDGSYIQALTGHSGLRKLSLCENRIGRNGYAVLATLLQNPNTELHVLVLADNEIDDERVVVLATGLTENSTLKELDLSKNPFITEIGWRTIFVTLKNPVCILEKLFLQENRINDAAGDSLADFLTNNSTLKALDLSCCRDITVARSRSLFEFLRSPNCKLEELHLLNTGFSDDVPISLAHSLINNRSLRSLDLSANCDITKIGWTAFSFILLNPHTVLENLCLSSCGMNDETVSSIANALTNNCRLRELRLSSNNDVTAAGWEAFSTVLQNPNSALEKLDLQSNSINDGTMISTANSLVKNNKLKELLLDGNYAISANGWAAFSRVLCNTSSIIATYHSNHILQKLCQEDMDIELPEDIRSLLVMNREYSKRQAARQKIIKTHFSCSHMNILSFVEMESKIMPFVLMLMAQNCSMNADMMTCGNGFSLLYQSVQNMASFFDLSSDANYSDGPRAKRRKVMIDW